MQIINMDNQTAADLNNLTLTGADTDNFIGGNTTVNENFCASCHTWYHGWHHNCCYPSWITVRTHDATEAQLLRAWLDGFLEAGGKLTAAKLKKIEKKLKEFV